jgi:hypothetical protein
MRQPIAVWLAVAFMMMAAPVAAQEMVGIFEGWGAFRADAQCYAIARPERIAGPQRSTASAGFSHRDSGPARFFAGLSRARRPGSSLTVTLGGRRFALDGRGTQAMASDAATDRAILSALRMANAMSIEGTDMRGRAIVDAYALAGAPHPPRWARLACLAR